jgi:hypothetical protein
MNIQLRHSRVTNAIAFVSVVALVALSSFPFNSATAASISAASDTMSSQKVNTLSSHTLRFITPTGASDNTDTIVITFPSDFDFTAKAISSVSFTHGPSTGLETVETLAAAPSGSAWGAVFSGTENRVLTLTAPSDGVGAGAVAPSDKIIITYDATNSTNPSAANTYSVAISGGFGDSGSMTVSIVNDDQVAIDATVAQSITFSISDNTVSFGTLTSGAARYASGTASGDSSEVEAHNIIVGTNAANGYTMTASGTTLTSGINTILPIGSSNTASSPGSEQFGLRMTATGGSGTVSAPYSAAGFAFDSAAFPDSVATSGTASANTTYSVRYLANITSNTEAGSYTSTVTYSATANY